MPTIGCGEKTWPNLESAIYDASRARGAIEDARNMRRILFALASRPGGIRMDVRALYSVSDSDELKTSTDAATGDLIIEVVRGR